jgi:hypothetical protein
MSTKKANTNTNTLRRRSRRNTNNANATEWRNNFNANIDRLIAQIDALKSQIQKEVYNLGAGPLDVLKQSLNRVQENVETYNIKNIPNIKLTYNAYIKHVTDNLHTYANSELYKMTKK